MRRKAIKFFYTCCLDVSFDRYMGVVIIVAL
jgi:hypothetical protein